jgi:hypothetical protein
MYGTINIKSCFYFPTQPNGNTLTYEHTQCLLKLHRVVGTARNKLIPYKTILVYVIVYPVYFLMELVSKRIRMTLCNRVGCRVRQL